MSDPRPEHGQLWYHHTVKTFEVLSVVGIFVFGCLVGGLTKPVPGMLGGVASLWWLVLLILTTASVAAVVAWRSEQSGQESQLTEVIGVPVASPADFFRSEREDEWEAFHTAVREAQRKAERRFTVAVQRAQDEAAESGAVELARVRDELERRHADELQHARRTVVEAFEALASSFPAREDGEAKPDPTGPSSATESDENAA